MFCCLSGGGDDEGALMMLLWVLCPDEEDERLEGEVRGIYSCSGEVLEVLLLLLQEVKPVVQVFHPL